MPKQEADLPLSEPLHLLISGYYGFHNLGDEAILSSMQQALRQEHDNLELTVLSANPALTRSSYDVKALSRTDYRAIWKELGKTDLLISGGGSLLQDVTSSRSLQYYLLILAMSLLRGTPFMIYSQGIGPIRGSWNRRITAWILKKARVLTVRDQQSFDELLRLGIPKERLFLSADPVLLFQAPPTMVGCTILEQLGVQTERGPIIGVSVRPWGNNEAWIMELAKALDAMVVERNAQIVFLPMQRNDDEKIGQRIRDSMKQKDLAFCLPHGKSVQELLSVIDACRLLIGVRLHALVFAAITTTPAIAIRYDPKVDHFAQRVGQTLAGNLADLRSEELLAYMNRHLDQPVDGKEALRKLDELRSQAHVSAYWAIRIAEGRRR